MIGMIRKNDSSTFLRKWGKTITPKSNWHISVNSIYTNKRTTPKRTQMKINLGRKYIDNWGYRSIGVHYMDGTDRYQKREKSMYEIYKEISTKLRKRGYPNTPWYNEKISFRNEKVLRKALPLLQNLCNKNGVEYHIEEKYVKHFPEVRLEKVKTIYTFPFL